MSTKPRYTLECANDRDWYNEHYRVIQRQTPHYYLYTLEEVAQALPPGGKLLELGVGQGHGLRLLVARYGFPQENIHAVDQSQVAIDFLRGHLPRAHLEARSIYDLEFPPESFDVILFMATIEHLEEPLKALRLIYAALKPGGTVFMNFPNYLHLPWWAVRILAEKLNHPNWIVLQPIDRIYTVFGVRRMFASAGFRYERCTGSVYFPPVLYQYEPAAVTRFLNRLRLGWLSFQPVLKFRK